MCILVSFLLLYQIWTIPYITECELPQCIYIKGMQEEIWFFFVLQSHSFTFLCNYQNVFDVSVYELFGILAAKSSNDDFNILSNAFHSVPQYVRIVCSQYQAFKQCWILIYNTIVFALFSVTKNVPKFICVSHPVWQLRWCTWW